MSEAWFGFLGVIVGAAVSLLGEQFTTRREREARQALRDQARKDARDAFQRETILALQDAMADLLRVVVRQHRKLLAEYAASGQWTATKIGEPQPPEYTDARWSINRLQARIFDQELRSLAMRVQDAASAMLHAQDPEATWERTREGNEVFAQLDERVNVLLRDLF